MEGNVFMHWIINFVMTLNKLIKRMIETSEQLSSMYRKLETAGRIHQNTEAKQDGTTFKSLMSLNFKSEFAWCIIPML